jgi:hypothetical protein
MIYLDCWPAKYAAERRPRRLLTFDGGGILGVMSLEILKEFERQLAKATGEGDKFRFGRHFDYIAGTSTGAIIAAGLAVGMSVDELIDFYVVEGPGIFSKAAILSRLRNAYTDQHLCRILQQHLGTRALGATDLQCLLTVVTRNATTDSPWPVSNNPYARYNDRARKDCNLQIPLWQLVRASTAAPTFFPPEVLRWGGDDPSKAFTFVDGGTTPYNNPAFLLYRMATAPEYHLEWLKGETNLAVVSIGTGSAPKIENAVRDYGRFQIVDGLELIGVLMSSAAIDQDINCRAVGRCVAGRAIDRELGDMIPREKGGALVPLETDLGRAFRYGRYDPDVSKSGLDALDLVHMDPHALQKMDKPEFIPQMREVGQAFARKYVSIDSFGGLLA